MKQLLIKDKKKRIKFYSKEHFSILYGYLYYLSYFNNNTKARLLYLKNQLNSYVCISNRCAISNRSKGLVSLCHISRMQFKDLINKGLLPYIQKSSW